MTTASSAPSGSAQSTFVTTRWSVVLSAADPGAPHAATALETLCRAYWYPLYAFVRRQNQSREDAADLTQTFFARFLEKNYLAGLRSEKGKFRAFLLAALTTLPNSELIKAQSPPGISTKGGHSEAPTPSLFLDGPGGSQYVLTKIEPIN